MKKATSVAPALLSNLQCRDMAGRGSGVADQQSDERRSSVHCSTAAQLKVVPLQPTHCDKSLSSR